MEGNEEWEREFERVRPMIEQMATTREGFITLIIAATKGLERSLREELRVAHASGNQTAPACSAGAERHHAPHVDTDDDVEMHNADGDDTLPDHPSPTKADSDDDDELSDSEADEAFEDARATDSNSPISVAESSPADVAEIADSIADSIAESIASSPAVEQRHAPSSRPTKKRDLRDVSAPHQAGDMPPYPRSVRPLPSHAVARLETVLQDANKVLAEGILSCPEDIRVRAESLMQHFKSPAFGQQMSSLYHEPGPRSARSGSAQSKTKSVPSSAFLEAQTEEPEVPINRMTPGGRFAPNTGSPLKKQVYRSSTAGSQKNRLDPEAWERKRQQLLDGFERGWDERVRITQESRKARGEKAAAAELKASLKRSESPIAN